MISNTISLRILVCHECADIKKCEGPCPCPIDGKDVIRHAKEGICPKNKYVISEEKNSVKPASQIFEKAKTFIEAQLTAKRVPLEVIQERYKTCQECQYHKVDPNKNEYCGLGCGCTTKPKFGLIKSLTEVEENLPKWGCKHPLRGRRNKGWKR